MASLKEVKGRIASVNSTRKITSAMKMVASAKLHKAQAAIESMLPYERRLHHILTDFMSNCTEVTSPFIVKREVKKVAVVVFASHGHGRFKRIKVVQVSLQGINILRSVGRPCATVLAAGP